MGTSCIYVPGITLGKTLLHRVQTHLVASPKWKCARVEYFVRTCSITALFGGLKKNPPCKACVNLYLPPQHSWNTIGMFVSESAVSYLGLLRRSRAKAGKKRQQLEFLTLNLISRLHVKMSCNLSPPRSLFPCLHNVIAWLRSSQEANFIQFHCSGTGLISATKDLP